MNQNEWRANLTQMKRRDDQEMVIRRNFSRAYQQILADMSFDPASISMHMIKGRFLLYLSGYGGSLLAIYSNDFICFYDWAECRLIRRIDVDVKCDVVFDHPSGGRLADEQGVEDAFDILYEINERVRTEIWVGDCFIYSNSSCRLKYCVGGKVTTIFHLDQPMYLLGYLANQSRVFLIDKEFNVIGYTL